MATRDRTRLAIDLLFLPKLTKCSKQKQKSGNLFCSTNENSGKCLGMRRSISVTGGSTLNNKCTMPLGRLLDGEQLDLMHQAGFLWSWTFDALQTVLEIHSLCVAANGCSSNAALLRTTDREISCEAKVLSEVFFNSGYDRRRCLPC